MYKQIFPEQTAPKQPHQRHFVCSYDYLRNEFNFWKGLMLTLQETRSIHDSMNIPKIEFIAYIYIYYKYLKYKKNLSRN